MAARYEMLRKKLRIATLYDTWVGKILEGQLNLKLSVKAHRCVSGRSSHIFYKISSQMQRRLSALRAARPLPPRKISGTHLC
jgi:hypothetical protein